MKASGVVARQALEGPVGAQAAGRPAEGEPGGLDQQRPRAAHRIDHRPPAVPPRGEHAGGGELLAHRRGGGDGAVAAAVERLARGVEEEGRAVAVEAQAQV